MAIGKADMEDSNLKRLNELFEKAVENNVNSRESSELKSLYSKFIDDGRESAPADAREKRNIDSF